MAENMRKGFEYQESKKLFIMRELEFAGMT